MKFAGHAHITGEGMPGNIPRILPDDCRVAIYRNAWVRPAIFRYTQAIGKISQAEMDRTFNQGVMVISIVDPDGPQPNDPNVFEIGHVEARAGREQQVMLIGEYREE